MLFRLTGVLFFSCQSVTKRRIRHLEVSRRNKLHGEVQNGGKETEKEKKKKKEMRREVFKKLFSKDSCYISHAANRRTCCFVTKTSLVRFLIF